MTHVSTDKRPIQIFSSLTILSIHTPDRPSSAGPLQPLLMFPVHLNAPLQYFCPRHPFLPLSIVCGARQKALCSSTFDKPWSTLRLAEEQTRTRSPPQRELASASFCLCAAWSSLGQTAEKQIHSCAADELTDNCITPPPPSPVD